MNKQKSNNNSHFMALSKLGKDLKTILQFIAHIKTENVGNIS